jgi:hydroxyethylthiazole kinase-like uncharacterized protein yjeF
MHGAPILSALAAEASGADLLYLFVPSCHEDVAKMASTNFQVRMFEEDALTERDIAPILELLASMDCTVIGPGLDRTPMTLAAIMQLIEGALCPLVLDASALQPATLRSVTGKTAVLTPHLGELERMCIPTERMMQAAVNHGVTILLKGPTDRIVALDGTLTESAGGTAGLTVGGTGDVLAGLIAGLIAQGEDPTRAAIRASAIIKRAAEHLKEQGRETFTAREVVEMVPFMMRE